MTIMSIGEEQVECPLCMEPLEMDDINFFPCTCGYQICRFCWHRIRTDENGLCPACRKAYPEDPAQFKPLTDDELQRIKKERKLKDVQRKQKAAESRKHLANVRVVQKNLVFAVGLSQRLGDVETLRKHDYFGKFGKIVKVVINQSTSYAGSQGPSASAYITYQKPEDALRAIQAVNNIHVDGRTLKASLGTTKYCSHFLKGTQCPKPDCMYLHDLGEESASFTKEEMQQGKHQEYEQKLYETYMNHLNTVNLASTTSQPSQSSKSRKKNSSPNRTTPDSISPPLPTQAGHKEAWPSLNTGQSGSSKSSERHTHSGGGGGKGARPSSSCSPAPSSATVPPSKPPSLLDVTVPRPPGLTTTLHRQSPPARHKNSQNTQPNTDTGSSHNSTPTTDCAPSIPPLLPAEPSRPPLLPTEPNRPPLLPTEPSRPPQATSFTQPPSQPSNLLNSQRGKSLFGDPADNMSLFGLSGFTRKPPGTQPAPALPLETGALDTPPVTSIPDTMPVSTSTDWSAAFGFKPSAAAVKGSGVHAGTGPVHPPPVAAMVTPAAAEVPVPCHTDSANDDDLGFDPWNESTKALQDLIEKESQPVPHEHTDRLHMLQQQQLRAAQEQRAKPLPPGFTPSHVNSVFPHNPLLTGSRMMSLMKLPVAPAPAHTPAFPPLDTPFPHTPLANGSLEGGAGSEAFNMKDWQAGLRALLPNINISFGSSQQQQLQQQQLQQQQKLHASGSLPPKNQNGSLDEPHWMASLQQLTDEPVMHPVSHMPHTHKLLPLGLRPTPVAPGFANPAVTTPPPGFQHPMRAQPHPLITDQPAHPLAESYQ